EPDAPGLGPPLRFDRLLLAPLCNASGVVAVRSAVHWPDAPGSPSPGVEQLLQVLDDRRPDLDRRLAEADDHEIPVGPHDDVLPLVAVRGERPGEAVPVPEPPVGAVAE